MKRTTTANNSRRPVCAIALGLTLTAANLMAARLTDAENDAKIGSPIALKAQPLKVRHPNIAPITLTTWNQTGVHNWFAPGDAPEPEPDPEPSSPDSDYTGTFYVTGADSGDGYDLDKPLAGDAYLCWAYAFACMVDWYQDMYESIGTTIPANEPRTASAIMTALKGISGNVSGSFTTAVSKYIQDGGYMLSYITTSDWNMYVPKAYRQYFYSSYPAELGTIEGFSQLLLENLYRAPAFVDLLEENSSSSGHAVVIWGAEFENGTVKSVYISDSDDNMYGYTKYDIVLKNGRIFLDGHWAPRVNALTFLWAPAGVELTVPVNPVEATSALLKSRDGRSVTVRIPHSSEWMKSYMKRHPDDYAARLEQDSDGDGFTDVAEYVAGTDPADKANYLRITALRFGSDGRPEVEYEPQANEGVGVFTVEGAPSPAGPWETHEDSDTAHRFFRVIVTPK